MMRNPSIRAAPSRGRDDGCGCLALSAIIEGNVYDATTTCRVASKSVGDTETYLAVMFVDGYNAPHDDVVATTSSSHKTSQTGPGSGERDDENRTQKHENTHDASHSFICNEKAPGVAHVEFGTANSHLGRATTYVLVTHWSATNVCLSIVNRGQLLRLGLDRRIECNILNYIKKESAFTITNQDDLRA